MFRITNPRYKERIEAMLKKQHFMHHIGFNMTHIEPGRTEGLLDVREIHQQQNGFAHGGLVATLADVVAGFAAFTLVPENFKVVTAEIKISYFHPGLGDQLQAIGYVIKSGHKINFCESEVWSIKGNDRKLIAKASTSMATIFPKPL